MWNRFRAAIARILGRKPHGKTPGREDANATHPSMPIPAVSPGAETFTGPDINNTRPVDLAAVGLAPVPPPTPTPPAESAVRPTPRGPGAPLDAAASMPPAEFTQEPTVRMGLPFTEAAPVSVSPASMNPPAFAVPDEPATTDRPAADARVAPTAGADEDEDDEDDKDDGDEEDAGEAKDEEDEGSEEDDDGGEYASQSRTARERKPFTRDRVAFGDELWGVSKRHRGATTDVSRLARFDLPVIRGEAELAAWLGIPLSRLRWYTFDRPADTTWHYVRYTVPKRSGGERVILAPKRELKALQRKVLDGIVSRVPVGVAAHGFVRGRSIVTNAQQHIGKRVLLKLDLKDFFPSITFPRVRGLFLALGYGYSVAAALALLCTEYEREPFERDGTRYYISVGPRHLVQGAPTSPALANLAAWRLDQRMSGLAAKYGFNYTRYADDLAFSSDADDELQHVRQLAQRIVQSEHFTVNTAKTRIARRAARQVVTGLVVNDGVSTPRALRRRLRAILHNAASAGLETQNRDARPNFRAYLQGQIAHVHAANATHAARLQADLRRLSGADL